MHIAHFGTFDVDNYGDLLFPYIARYRWPDCNWVHVSPTGKTTSFHDALPSITVQQAFEEKFDAAIIGGGNIIHPRPTSLKAYKEVSNLAYPSLWIGAAKLASEQQIPLTFNAPGIYTTEHTFLQRVLFRSVFSHSSYISFREQESVRIASSFTAKQCEIVPDTAFDIAKMWPTTAPPDNTFIVVNLNPRYHSPVEKTAKYLDIISEKFNLPIKFIIIGACHGDLEFSQKVQDRATTNDSIIEDISSLKNMAHSIANARYFIGSSMHGFITALSYRIPSLLLLNSNPMRKFTGLLDITELPPGIICNSWEQVMSQLDTPALLSERSATKIDIALDKHWGKMRDVIEQKKNNKRSFILSQYKRILRVDKYLQRLLK